MSGFNMENYKAGDINTLREDVLSEKDGMTPSEAECFDMGRAFGMFEAVAIILEEVSIKGEDGVNLHGVAKKISLAGFTVILESE